MESSLIILLLLHLVTLLMLGVLWHLCRCFLAMYREDMERHMDREPEETFSRNGVKAGHPRGRP